ncbi:transposase [Vagococcus acidifermentans]|uniref:Transposase n=1 Tax=Vagococcus acidifermentans TaxID=564710 RepID=A0A430AZE8_9ENTE|nr:transposase [Vagococcus acidifermentans]RSU13457.1 hypothetical protein CBF27_04575 [Vagococcus acidifermentans]
MKRRSYSKEFKRQAVLLVLNEGNPPQTVAKQLDVHVNSLYRWITEYETYGERAFPGKGSREFIRQNQLKQLQKENQALKEELEILKKFRVFLKKSPR